MFRQITLSFCEKPIEVYEVPLLAIHLSKVLAPIANSDGPIPFRVDNEVDAIVFRNMIKWLRREANISDLVSDMHDFRATVRFADKYDIQQLFEDLDLWYCGTMVTLPKLLCSIDTQVDILAECDTCDLKHIVMSSSDPLSQSTTIPSSNLNQQLTYHKCCSPCNMTNVNGVLPPRFSGIFAIIESMLTQRLSDFEEEHDGKYDLESQHESIEPLPDYYLAAKFNMKRMLAILLPYTLYMTGKDRCFRVTYFERLHDLNPKIASSWALAAFKQHSGYCYGH